jgi:hypothetical protein
VNGPSIRVHVSTRAAILAGKSRIGPQSIEITDEALAKLNETQKAEVAALLEGEPELGLMPSDPLIVEPTMEAVIAALDARAATRKAREEAIRVAKARADEEAAVAVHAAKAKEGTRAKALRDWVEKNGDDEQKARMAEGFLPEDEILDAIQDELLDLPYARYDRLRRGDACDCACAGNVSFMTRGPLYMDSAQYARLQTVRENAPEGALVEPIEHKAACPSCKCVPIARLTARVTLDWKGWRLVREFSLD